MLQGCHTLKCGGAVSVYTNCLKTIFYCISPGGGVRPAGWLGHASSASSMFAVQCSDDEQYMSRMKEKDA